MGIDWASDSYQICVSDDKGEVLEEIQVEHGGEGIRQRIDWLLKLADGDVGTVAVAIEVPHGAMVENLIESNLAVFAINPKQMDAFATGGRRQGRRSGCVCDGGLAEDRSAVFSSRGR